MLLRKRFAHAGVAKKVLTSVNAIGRKEKSASKLALRKQDEIGQALTSPERIEKEVSPSESITVHLLIFLKYVESARSLEIALINISRGKNAPTYPIPKPAPS